MAEIYGPDAATRRELAGKVRQEPWWLLTDRPVETAEQATEVFRMYCQRWAIEDAFKTGKIQTLIVSKVANFSIDLPDANVAIQVSGTFGSRQEEAQRLGRILRPKCGENRAYFYTVITQMTAEEKFAHNRQLFLTEQGYTYVILNEKMFNEKFS